MFKCLSVSLDANGEDITTLAALYLMPVSNATVLEVRKACIGTLRPFSTVTTGTHEEHS